MGIFVSKILALKETSFDIFPEISKSNAAFVTVFWLFPDVIPLLMKPLVCSPSNNFISEVFLLVVKLYNFPVFEPLAMINFSSNGV